MLCCRRVEFSTALKLCMLCYGLLIRHDMSLHLHERVPCDRLLLVLTCDTRETKYCVHDLKCCEPWCSADARDAARPQRASARRKRAAASLLARLPHHDESEGEQSGARDEGPGGHVQPVAGDGDCGERHRQSVLDLSCCFVTSSAFKQSGMVTLHRRRLVLAASTCLAPYCWCISKHTSVAFRQALDRVAGVREPDAAAKHARNRGRLGEVR